MQEIELIKTLEIRIDKDSKFPHIVLNGVDFKEKQIGLRRLQITWDTYSVEPQRGIIRLDYLQKEDNDLLREISVSQSFAGGLIKRE